VPSWRKAFAIAQFPKSIISPLAIASMLDLAKLVNQKGLSLFFVCQMKGVSDVLLSLDV